MVPCPVRRRTEAMVKAVPTRAPHLPWVCWAVQYQGDPKAFSSGGEGWGAAEKLEAGLWRRGGHPV